MHAHVLDVHVCVCKMNTCVICSCPPQYSRDSSRRYQERCGGAEVQSS